MLSIMTVRVNEFSQSISNGAKVTLSGTLSFNYYEKGVVEKKLNFIANSTAVLPIVDSDHNGVAIGYMDNSNKTPVFKIQQFIPSSNLVDAEEVIEDLAVEVV